MPRGGKRPGAGRPPVRQGDGPRVTVSLDERSGVGVLGYAQAHGVTVADALRELAAAWGEDPAVRKALASWRKKRTSP